MVVPFSIVRESETLKLGQNHSWRGFPPGFRKSISRGQSPGSSTADTAAEVFYFFSSI